MAIILPQKPGSRYLPSIDDTPRAVNQRLSAACGLAQMPERPLLTARWTDLLLLNFAVPAEVIAGLAPPGTDPDLHDGKSYISVVGFQFQNVRLFGLPIPGHTRFDEINLRYYVKRIVGSEVRRGVVFVREIVPRRAIAIVANRLYNENYVTRPMRTVITTTGAELRPGDKIEYGWSSERGRPWRGQRQRDWNRLAARVAAPLELPSAGSLDEFIVEHYWGYVRGRHGQTREYHVAHPPWRVAPADDVTWDCDIPATYDTPLAEYLAVRPASALVAEGSAVQVFRGRRVEGREAASDGDVLQLRDR
jgi:uncharacterized protein YqjF (DUF2071 family)